MLCCNASARQQVIFFSIVIINLMHHFSCLAVMEFPLCSAYFAPLIVMLSTSQLGLSLFVLEVQPLLMPSAKLGELIHHYHACTHLC